MKISVYKKSGVKSGEIDVPAVFEKNVSERLLTQYINYVRAALHAPVANTKNRGQVSGGGKKPWRQKGTGNARVGSTRSPLWVGGGVTFGPSKERNFAKRINANARRHVILSIFGTFIKNNQAKIVEDFILTTPKTSEAMSILNKIGAEGKVSLILSENDTNAELSVRNLSGVKSMHCTWLDILYLYSSNQVIFSQEAFAGLEKVYGTAKSRVKQVKDDE